MFCLTVSEPEPVASEDDLPKPAPLDNIVNVTPKNLTNLLGKGKNVLVTLYTPGLPKWQNFSVILSSLAEEFSGNDSNLILVKANCREYPVRPPVVS